MRRHVTRRFTAILIAVGSLAPAMHQACAAPDVLQHQGYMCADIEGARAVAAEMLNENPGYDTVWDVVDAVRAEGHDCTHTRSGPVKVKVVADIEKIAAAKNPPLHIVEAINLKTKATVFVIAPLE